VNTTINHRLDNMGVPILIFWLRDPEHAPIGANSCTVLIVLDSLKIHVKIERSSFSESRDNRGVPNLQFWSRDPHHAPLRDKLHINFIVLIGLKFSVKFERSTLNHG